MKIYTDIDLTTQIKSKALELGGNLVGIADVSSALDYVRELSGVDFSGLNTAISVAVHFPDEVVKLLLKGPSYIYTTLTYLFYYQTLNDLLDDIALKLSHCLYQCGFRSFPIPSSQRIGKDRLESIFPHRLAAGLAGIGWWGKNGLIITEEFGPRVRLVTVLTNAPLVPDEPLENKCGDCQLCVEACPPRAIYPEGFDKYLRGEADRAIDAKKCDEYLNKVRDRYRKRVCGLCVAVCPVGTSMIK